MSLAILEVIPSFQHWSQAPSGVLFWFWVPHFKKDVDKLKRVLSRAIKMIGVLESLTHRRVGRTRII